jgi:hypothetical protein
MAKEYEINEADIEWMINKIKKIDPNHATPEMAIIQLENMIAKHHLLAHENPEVLYALFKDFKKKD